MLRKVIRVPGHKFACGPSASAKGSGHAIAKRAPSFERPTPYRPGLKSGTRLFRPSKGPSLNLSKQKTNALLALALFTFVFLAAEFRFDINIGLLAGAERVVIAQGFILGASVLGFIGYAPLLALAQRKGQPQAIATAAVPIAILGLTQVQFPAGTLALEILGCMSFLGLGLLGAAAHHTFALAFQDDPKLATGAGAAYAAGILMQFAINLLDCEGIVELIVLGAATIVISALSTASQTADEGSSHTVNPFIEPSHALAKQAWWSIALVMILACLFSTLDNVVTFSNAHGTIAVQSWPRLFLAASGLVAGIVFDLAERRYMGLVMLGVTVLSTISILAVEAGADPNLGLIVFYLSSGFFVTFFTATFTQLAPRMRAPALWAGMGRAANNVCAFTTSGVSLALVASGNVALIMIGAVMLLVAASAAFVAAGLFRLPQTEQEREHQKLAEEALAAPSIEEQRQAFIADHGLTPREVDVLMAVTQDERPLKQIAEELGISMRMVQRHLSSIYQKTDTQTRAGLTKAFPSL